MEAKRIRYPIGIQTFRNIVEGGYLYIDKTGFVHDLAENYKYVFLSRPRRFGKSLLSSTIHSYFAGEAELFNGLKAGELKKEWTKHPVFHFDMSTAKHLDEDALRKIDKKGYLIPYRFEGADSASDASTCSATDSEIDCGTSASSATGRVLVKVGVNISTQTRTIESWEIAQE